MGVGEQAATALALVIHELATNSLKYGALSVTSGMLDISGTSADRQVSIAWTERGGPAVTPPGGDGYGSKLLNRSVTGQLGGTLKTEWSTEGVIVNLILDAEKLSA
jgi:two-component sensor histidine kinase